MQIQQRLNVTVQSDLHKLRNKSIHVQDQSDKQLIRWNMLEQRNRRQDRTKQMLRQEAQATPLQGQTSRSVAMEEKQREPCYRSNLSIGPSRYRRKRTSQAIKINQMNHGAAARTGGARNALAAEREKEGRRNPWSRQPWHGGGPSSA